MASLVNSFTIQRGRGSEFERIGMGQANLVVNNRNGWFDPSNTGGPFYEALLPLAQAKINMQHPFSAEWFDLFTGYTEEIQQVRNSPRNMIATMPLVDGFEILNQAQINSMGGRTRDTARALQKGGSYYAAQHVDSRIIAALQDAGWPALYRRIATGNVNVQHRTYDVDGSMLEVCQEAADAELPAVANFFMDKGGNAAFSGRQIRFQSVAEVLDHGTVDTYPDWVSLWRVGDSGAMADDPTILLPIQKDNFGWTKGKNTVYNDVQILPAGVDASDVPGMRSIAGASRDQYGSRQLSITDLIVLTGYDPDFTKDESQVCNDYASWYSQKYADPHQRITNIEFRGQMAAGHEDDGIGSALWDFLLNVEINHLIQVYTQNPGGGGFVGELFFVEGIRYSCSSLNMRLPNLVMNLDLSPAAKYDFDFGGGGGD